MAALEVVQKRLASIGIGPFCMELHSNKSKKKDVLEQLRQAMDVTRGQTCEQYQRKAEQAASLRESWASMRRPFTTPSPAARRCSSWWISMRKIAPHLTCGPLHRNSWSMRGRQNWSGSSPQWNG